jgi:hypothetical protein
MNESTTPESMSAEEEEEYLTRHLKHLQDVCPNTAATYKSKFDF